MASDLIGGHQLENHDAGKYMEDRIMEAFTDFNDPVPHDPVSVRCLADRVHLCYRPRLEAFLSLPNLANK
jgi:hypothetical protein